MASELLPTDVGQLQRRVCRALRQVHAELCHVEVVEKDGVVELRGYVPTFYLKQLAQECIRHVPGVFTVKNRIQVRV